MDTVEVLFGTGKDLSAPQMAARALVMFFITLALIRITSMRAFGHKSAFDAILVIMLGAVLSRAISGASPFWPTVAAGAVLVSVHRAVAFATARWTWLENALKGKECVLYRNGEFSWDAMRRVGISRADLDEAVRAHAGEASLAAVAQINMETSGQLSVIVAKPPRAASSNTATREDIR